MLPLRELLTLAAICCHVRPKRVFEIGTYRGSSTFVLAVHAPEDAEILTLDLSPGAQHTRYRLELGDITGRPFVLGERYRGTPCASKIRQLYGDSADFDFGPYRGTVDLVFIDGNHAYENVKADSENAFGLLRPGGAVVWDDYAPESGPGVMRALHELQSRRLYRLPGTRLAVYRQGA
jgi:predicted O-methyltransferase YrrM